MPEQLSTQQHINFLFTQITREDGRLYSAAEVAEKTGVSASLISALRSGHRTNPSLETLRALLEFFDVSLAYMETKTKEEALEFLHTPRPVEEQALLRFRGADRQGLSPKARKQVEALLRFVVEYERAVAVGQPEPQPPRFDEEGNVIDEI